MKKIFKIDCGLYPLGLLTILTGFGLHMAGHGSNHHVWEACAVVHTLVAISLTILLTHTFAPIGHGSRRYAKAAFSTSG